jgi:hypothetical protein
LRWRRRVQGNSIHGRIDLEDMTVLIPRARLLSEFR